MKIALVSGAEAEYDLQEPDSFPSSYFFSIERSGSSLFWYIVTDLLKEAGRSYCEPLEHLFTQGITRSQIDTNALRALLARPGYAFGMLRSLDEAVQGLDLSQNKKFLLIRDPRDVLVSLYFSMAGSHWVPAEGRAREEILKTRELTTGSVGEFATSEVLGNIHGRYSEYRQFCERHGDVTIFRYEDVIFDKMSWITRLIKLLALAVPSNAARRIADKHDRLPTKERPSENVRQVRPGNWKAHLDEKSIARIEEMFSREMAFFGYVPEVAFTDTFHQFLPQFCTAVAQRLSSAEDQMFGAARERRRVRQTLCHRISSFLKL